MCVRILPSQVSPHLGLEAVAKMTPVEFPQICEEKSAYDELVYNLQNNPKFLRELTTGKRVGLYKFRGELGRGNFSTVKLAYHQLTKDKVAIKIIEKSKLDHKTQRMLSREISNMEVTIHPNIIRLFEVVETYSRINLVLEFAPEGELFNKVSAEGKLSEASSARVFGQILAAVSYLHQLSIVHRDIKAENVFLSYGGRVKLGDFGFSTRLVTQSQQLSTFCGSPPYAAPELYKDESYHGPAVDLWAMGVLLFFMLTADMPFKSSTVAGLKRYILAGAYIIPLHVSDHASDLIHKLLVLNPEVRLSTTGMSVHPWLHGWDSSFMESLPSHVSIPRPYAPAELLTDYELETLTDLERWGITRESLYAGMSAGSRSSVIATYRIYLHHLLEQQLRQKQSLSVTPYLDNNGLVPDSPDTISPQDSRPVSPKRRIYLKNAFCKESKPHSKSCVVL